MIKNLQIISKKIFVSNDLFGRYIEYFSSNKKILKKILPSLKAKFYRKFRKFINSVNFKNFYILKTPIDRKCHDNLFLAILFSLRFDRRIEHEKRLRCSPLQIFVMGLTILRFDPIHIPRGCLENFYTHLGDYVPIRKKNGFFDNPFFQINKILL